MCLASTSEGEEEEGRFVGVGVASVGLVPGERTFNPTDSGNA